MTTEFLEIYIDQCIKFGLVMYFWPIYQLGLQDEWLKMGVTLNGIKPIC